MPGQGFRLASFRLASQQPPVVYETVIPNPKLKLLDQIREVMPLKHYSIRTEQTYCDWVRRFVQFHGIRSREEMLPAEPKIEQFLSDLASPRFRRLKSQSYRARARHTLQLGHAPACVGTQRGRTLELPGTGRMLSSCAT